MRKATWVVLGLVLLLLVALLSGATFLTDWLWFKSIGASAIFWTGVLTNTTVRLIAWSLTAAFLFLQFGLAMRAFRRLRPRGEGDGLFDQFELGKTSSFWINLAASSILALFLGAAFNPGWPAIQQFLHAVPIGQADPILGLDAGYYLFRFPIWRSLNQLLQGALWLGLIGSFLIYLAAQAFWRQGQSYMLWPQAKLHLTLLAALLFLAKIWGYALSRQGLLLHETGLLTGVDYTAAHVRMPVFVILSWIAAGCILILLAGLFRRGVSLLAGGVGLLLAASFLLGGIYPGLIRAFVVRPNELRVERDYLQNHIDFTRRAFGLDRFAVRTYPFAAAGEALTLENPTLANLRLWDYRQLRQSYEQLQALQPYYRFNDIDIDRYEIDGRERQVMLSAREIDPRELPENAQNWVNIHLAYTHGYGVAMNAVNEVNQEGQPVFLVGNIPPATASGTGLPRVERPQIYFGETQGDYLVVPNDYNEFDHPTETGAGAATRYDGQDGVPLASSWTRMLFALRFGEYNFLLSKYITPESKVLLYRRVADRVRAIAPFLDYDPDPYIVLASGRLYWIMDAYTSSANYPYAARHPGSGTNYIRNPVKVVIDAYEGTVRFYVIEPDEPVIRIWQRVFPDLFLPGAEMPAEIRAHLRYPERLFRIQRDMLLLYHMTDPAAFFRKDDAWAVPTEITTGPEEEMSPYYVTLQLPGETSGEFVLMQPLKPRTERRKNMIAWMAARSDGDRYGQVLVYLLPKDRIIYGPIQIEGRIAQNPEISKLLTLWGQQQSEVVRGNLLVLPFRGDFLYVEPTYIVSNQGQQPELKLIVLVYRDRIAYGSTLAEALAMLAGAAAPAQVPTGPGPAEGAPRSERDELLRALDELERSIKAQQEALARQERALSELRRRIGR